MSEDSWDKIEEAYDEDQWASLLEVCTRRLKQDPEHLHARIWKAIALIHLKHFDEAVSLFKSTSEDPNASVKRKHQCQRQLGQAFEEMGRFDDARRAYKEAHRLDPKSTIPLIYRGSMELGLGKFEAAREWLMRALERPEGLFDEAHFNIGSTYICERNYEKAIEHYQKAITIEPNYDIAWERLADAKRALEIQQQSK